MLKIKADRIKEITNYGYRFSGNYNRGDNWTKEIADCIGGGIIIQGEWADYKISYLYPYRKEKYPPIKNYIQDLINADMIEEDNE